MVEKTQVVIIGGGIAGAACAYFLARKGCREILLLEKEILCGSHASGRNAAMMRQNVPEEVNCRLAVESMRFFHHPPEDFPYPLDFRKNGSLILASGSALEELRGCAAMQKRLGLEVRFLTPRETLDLVPALDGSMFEGGFHCPSDGTVDIHGLLQGFLQGARRLGAQIRTQTELLSIRTQKGRVCGVLSSQGEIEAETVVNAAGAWAAELAGPMASQIPIRPFRRHLVTTEPLSWVRPEWPFTWNVNEGFYFRPESGGLLMSPCDEELMPACNAPVDFFQVEQTAQKSLRNIKNIETAGVAHAWAGLRSLTPDHLFAVGEDPKLPGFFWLAGLGGHGMTASPLLGQAAADLILEGKTDALDVSGLAPGRFERGRAKKATLGKEALL